MKVAEHEHDPLDVAVYHVREVQWHQHTTRLLALLLLVLPAKPTKETAKRTEKKLLRTVAYAVRMLSLSLYNTNVCGYD